jgi:hypothetical protein
MAEIILRGKAGPLTVRREGKAIVTKKTVTGATIEERTVATRITGKSAAQATHTHAELRAVTKAVELTAVDLVKGAQAIAAAKNKANLDEAEEKMKKKIEAATKKITKQGKAAVKQATVRISHLSNKLISAKEDGKANTKAWDRMKVELKESKAELKKLVDKADAKKEKKDEKKRAASTSDLVQTTLT